MADIIKITDDTYRVEDKGVRFYIFCGKKKALEGKAGRV